MEKIPTAEEFNNDIRYVTYSLDEKLITFAKMHVEAMMKDMEQKLLNTLDDMNYLEENVCGVIEEIRKYKPDNIK